MIKQLTGVLVASAALMLGACEGGGNGSPSGTARTGTVGILLTDGPSDRFDAIDVTIREIQLLSDDGPVSVFRGPRTINLLDLRSHSELFALADDVVTGEFNKIRLLVDKIELIELEDDGSVAESHSVRLPGNGKIDLNPRAPFNVAPGETLLIQLDIDAKKSLHFHRGGGGEWRFRPVIFVNIIGHQRDNRLVRLSGEAQDVDAEGNTLSLCSTGASASWTRCVEVEAGESSLFDAAGPIMLGDVAPGDPLTVIGFLRPTVLMERAAHHKDKHRNGNRDDDDDDEDENDEDEDEDSGYRDRERVADLRGLTMHAVVIEAGEPGTFATLDGTVRSAPADAAAAFDYELGPGQGFVAGQQIGVQLQAGTRVFSRNGQALDFAAIAVDTPATVDGVLMLSDTAPDRVNAALVVLDIAAVTQLTGTLGPVESASFPLLTDSGDRCVRFDDATGVFVVTIDAAGSSTAEATTADLAAGQMADVFGAEGVGGCFEAATIIVVVDERPEI